MMHSTENSVSTGVPAFLHKLWTLVEDESTNDLIAWDPTGISFHVYEQSRFSKEVLPHYFKHSNIASFIRQLNMYGFRKVSNVEHGGLKIEKDDMEFSHPYFQRGQDHLLENIKRKVASSKSDDVRLKPDDVGKVLRDVHSLKGRQENITSKMDALERENEALWREVASLRQKHHKQQKIVNKLIQFLVTLVGNRGLGGGGGVKRKLPLMINDVSQLSSTPPPAKLQRQYSIESQNLNASNIEVIPTVESPDPISSSSGHQSSMKIEEMVDVGQPQATVPEYSIVNDRVAAGTSQPQTYIIINPTTLNQKASGAQPVKSVVTGPQKLVVTNPVPAPVTAAPVLNLSTAASSTGPAHLSTTQPPQPPGYSLLKKIKAENDVLEETETDPVFSSMSFTPMQNTSKAVAIPEHVKQPILTDVSGQISSVDNSLDDLRELLSGNVDLSGLRLDTDTLTGLFTPEAPIPQTPESLFNLSEEGKPEFVNADNIMGNEMVQYNPPDDLGALFDLGVESPGDTEEDVIIPETIIDDLMTPSLELSSPLAQRRKSKNSTITTEELD